MRIVHTSDWHLGRRLDGESLSRPHEEFLSWLTTDFLPQEKPELLVVSGDIYDRAIPPTDAVELFEDSLDAIKSLGIRVLVASGNHDSRVRLGANTRFLNSSGLHFRTKLVQIVQPVEIESENFSLLSYGVPYIEPDVDAGIQEHQWEVEANQTAVLAEAMRRVTADVQDRRKRSGKPLRVLVASHAFVQGASPTDSERNTKVGGLGQADAVVFEGADYVAMGHLHGPQSVRSPIGTKVHYSGSPIPFSFSERNHLKQVFTVEINESGVIGEVQGTPIPQLRKMSQHEGTFEELLSDAFVPSDDWVKVVLMGKEIPINAFDTLKRKFPHLLELDIRRSGPGLSGRNSDGISLQQLTPEEITKRFIERVTDSEVAPEMLSAIADCCGEVSKEAIQVNK